jgi:RNA polymerase sigma factor (sigma-70 family)
VLREREPDWNSLIEDCFKRPQDNSRLSRFIESLLPYLRAALTATYSQDPTIVQDALQSAFVKYIEIFRKGKKSGKLQLGYFVVIAKNCLIDELRRRKGQIPIDELAQEEIPIHQTADTQNFEDRMVFLQYAMSRLDPRCQSVLESYYIDEIDAARLAGWLDVSGESVHMIIKRCRDRLRSVVAELRTDIARPAVTTNTEK